MDKQVSRQGKRTKTWMQVLGIVVVALTIPSAVFLGAYFGMTAVAGSPAFAEGTAVNDIDIGGMDLDEARSVVLENEEAKATKIVIPLEYNGAHIDLNAADLGIGNNAEEVLAEAYAYDKNGALPQNFDNALSPQSYHTEQSIDGDTLKKSVAAFLAIHDIAPTDAKALLNTQNRQFTYVAEKSGMRADTDAVCALILDKIANEDYSLLIVSDDLVETLDADITGEELTHNTVLIGQCRTQAGSSEDRNTNIRLMCEAVDGQVLQPGEALSINDLVGERTLDKGFKMAPSIVDGQLVDDVGGGICQLAGTLYNAALLADMEIVERVHHTWPSDYLPIGLDATLNWDNKDLKIKNRSDYPLYIAASFSDYTVDVEIYGQPQPEGVEIEIENRIIKEIPAPSPEVIYTNNLRKGVTKTQVKSRKGYEVEIYRHYIRNGEILRSELISVDHFRTVQGTVLKGTDRVIK